MKLLIGYDGSACSDAAVDELRWAGLPETGEAVVLSAADAWPHVADLPDQPVTAGSGIGPGYPFASPTLLAVRAIALGAAKEADALSRAGEDRLRQVLPTGWAIQRDAATVSPASALIERADSLCPDLIVVGSSGQSAVSRLFLGSVSHAVLVHARGSVRIGRGRQATGGPLRVVVGFDGSAGAWLAVRAVAARAWPKGTEARVAMALRHADALGRSQLDALEGELESAAATLRDAGDLCVTSTIHEGEPQHVLVGLAEDGFADCIFVGARGLGRIGRLLIGSVSTAVASRAACTVEVVRPLVAS